MSIKKYLSSLESIGNRKILITGPTAGIGLAFVKTLLLKGATNLVFLAINKEKSYKIIAELKEKYSSASISFVHFDQSDYKCIDEAIKEIVSSHSDFDSLVCNAGILHPNPEAKSSQGYPLTIDTNFIGLAYFIKNLLPKIEPGKTIIFQGSCVAGFKVKEDIDLINNSLSLWGQYNLSKAGVESLFYYYYTSNKDHKFILAEPGITSSDLFKNLNRTFATLGRQLIKTVSHSLNKACLTLYKGIEKSSSSGDYYVPRGIGTYMGLPKKKKFPKKRRRQYLAKKAFDLI